MIYKSILLIAGWIFYLIESPESLLYLIGVTLISYAAGREIGSSRGDSASSSTESNSIRSKAILTGAVIFIIGLLVFFKYGYLAANISVVVPLGLSYYSLMVIGYLTDVYHGKVESEKDLLNYALFVGFFPQVTAGPIGRAKELLTQYERGLTLSPEEMKSGFAMIITGVAEKFILADNLKAVVDGIIENGATGIVIFLAMCLYSLVIYFDFAGYSLIALGVARALGVRLMDNFRSPYMAVSIQEFWRRWHISLSSWFRDYVYIPLGGSKKGSLRRDINTLIVFVLSGAWHGSGIGFWMWGLIHGVYLIVENHLRKIMQSFRGRSPESLVTDETAGHEDAKDNNRSKAEVKIFSAVAKKYIKRIAVFLLVSLAWVPFYSVKLWRTLDIYTRMADTNLEGLKTSLDDCFGLRWQIWLICGVVLVLAIAKAIYQERRDYTLFDTISKHGVVIFVSAVLVLTAFLLVGRYGVGYDASSFIYGGF